MNIGVLGASSPVSPQVFERALKKAESLGHKIICPLDPTVNYGQKTDLFSCGTVESRLNALKELLLNPDVELILAARGGNGAIELVDGIKELKEELKLKPLTRKVCLSGFSDATVLLLALDGVANLQLVHGPSFLNAFSEQAPGAFDELEQIVGNRWEGKHPLKLELLCGIKPDAGLICNFTGGNLSVISSLIGSAAMPDLNGRALFLEETGEKPHRIHRALMQLKNSGALDGLKAVLIGDFTDCAHAKGLGPDYLDVLKAVFSEYSYPVFSGYPAGHGDKNYPLPFGRDLKLNLFSIEPI